VLPNILTLWSIPVIHINLVTEGNNQCQFGFALCSVYFFCCSKERDLTMFPILKVTSGSLILQTCLISICAGSYAWWICTPAWSKIHSLLSCLLKCSYAACLNFTHLYLFLVMFH